MPLNGSQHAVNLRDGIVAAIRASLPDDVVPDVRAFDGEVTPEMIRTHTFRSPAVIVTVLAGDTERRGSSIRDLLKFGVYVLVKASAGLNSADQRSKAALILREHLAKLLHETDAYPTGNAKIPTRIGWANLFNGKIDGMGLALWCGAWEHELDIPALEPGEYDALDVFRRLWVEAFNPGEVPAEVETGTALTEQQIDLEQDDP